MSVPVETRWSSTYTALDKLCQNKEYLELAVIDKRLSSIMDKSIRSWVLDENFWFLAQNTCELLKPIALGINSLEGDKPNLSYAYDTIKSIENEIHANLGYLNKNEAKLIKQKLSERRKFMFHPCQLAANFLNPKLKGKNLSEEEMSTAIDFIVNMGSYLNLNEAELLKDIADYRIKNSLWKSLIIWKAAEATEPSSWWQAYCDKRDISKIAVILLNIPSTATACERNWKTFSTTKTKKRNRLTISRTNKLVFVKHNLKLVTEEDFIEFENSGKEPDSVIAGEEKEEELTDSMSLDDAYSEYDVLEVNTDYEDEDENEEKDSLVCITSAIFFIFDIFIKKSRKTIFFRMIFV